MGCDTMPTKSSLDHGMQDREALELVLENLSMIGLQSNFFEKDIRPLNDDTNDQLQVERRRVSANITENIPVPSSEHVAEIVGKQGCKIKALRQKTNTYIKTPGRGDEPVFIITGRREDVDLAKSEILQASEHFSNIRAQRKGVAPPPIQPGQITKTIRVPYRVVGLVVGPKGQTIKQIQQKTQTYIVTPSRERDPVFEITGLPDSVEQARIEISNYIAARTGTFIDSEKKAIAPAVSMGNTWNGERNGSFSREPVMPEEINEFLEEIFSGSSNRSPLLKHENRKRNSVDILSNESGTVEPSLVQNGTSDQYVMWNHGFNGNLKSVIPINNASHVSEILQTSGTSDPSSSGSSSTYSSFSFEASPLVRSSSFPVSSSESVTSAPGARKGSDSLRQTSLLASQTAASTVASSHPWGTTMINDGINESSFLPANVLPVNVSSMLMNGTENMPAGLQTGAVGTVMGDVLANGPGIMKNCIMCDCNQISAALVPCGHNLFCYDCVSSLVQSPNAFCPVCHQPADHALRILQ